MPELIINIILAILSIVGLIYLYQLISGWLLRSKNACRQYTILQFDENEEDAEYILRGHISKIKSEHSEQYSRILCIRRNDEQRNETRMQNIRARISVCDCLFSESGT